MPEPGGDPIELGDALDLDLGLSPVFNTMPVLRHHLHNGGSAEDFLMIWISVPDLSIHASPQRYTFLERRSGEQRLVRFEAVGKGEDFVADVQFDSDGLVVDYPGIASRIGGGSLGWCERPSATVAGLAQLSRAGLGEHHPVAPHRSSSPFTQTEVSDL